MNAYHNVLAYIDDRADPDKAFDGTLGALMHFLLRDDRLSESDRETLRRIMESKQSDEGER